MIINTFLVHLHGWWFCCIIHHWAGKITENLGFLCEIPKARRCVIVSLPQYCNSLKKNSLTVCDIKRNDQTNRTDND